MIHRLGPAAVVLLALSVPAWSQDRGSAPETAVRSSTLIVFGDDPCPRSSDEEIVVCARLPEGERYRIPKPLRGRKPEPAQESWASRARVLEYVSRVGTPNSCSPVGTAGQTGCYQMFMRMAREERNQARADAATIP